MEELLRFLNQPFTYGFASAILICFGVWILTGGPRRMLRLEMRKKDEEIHQREQKLDALRDQLHTQMEINSKGTEQLKKERDELAERNKNLEINISTLQQKPGRAERRQLALYQVALDRMFAEAPGFATAWQNALTKAEGDLGRNEQGLGGFIRNMVTKALPAGTHDEETDTAELAIEPAREDETKPAREDETKPGRSTPTGSETGTPESPSERES